MGKHAPQHIVWNKYMGHTFDFSKGSVEYNLGSNTAEEWSIVGLWCQILAGLSHFKCRIVRQKVASRNHQQQRALKKSEGLHF